MSALLDRPRVLGCTEPRIFTRPLRELTSETTLGFQAIEFAENVLHVQLLPWQKWWLLHALELKLDGTFRFRTIITLIARQNGKTTLLKIVSLWFMYLRHGLLVLGAAQSLDIAREAWQGAVELAEDIPDLAAEVQNVRRANGEQCLTLNSGARYRITAATRSAGRGLSVDLLVLDELREHRDWGAWGALSKTTTARPHALIVGISNAGDDESVVLNALRASAIAAIEVASMRAFAHTVEEIDDSIALFEWSAPDGCELDDIEAWAQANPGLGYTITESTIRSSMNTDPPAVFRTEVLCQRVDALDAAVDIAAWRSCADKGITLAKVRSRVVACLDVAPDGRHATLVGAAMLDDGRIAVQVLAAWSSTEEARQALPELLTQIGPQQVGWFPSGPAAALAADLRIFEAVEIKGAEVGETCQEFADLVTARRIVQPDDPLLNAHLAGSQKLRTGDGWRFMRRGSGHVDGSYAVAGAVHLARTLPPPPKRVRSRIF